MKNIRLSNSRPCPHLI